MKISVRTLAALAFAAVTVPSAIAQKLFDPAADPVRDLKASETLAGKQHKNILLDVGGDWCVWCKLVDKTLNEDAELKALLDKNFVVLRVNYSKENENTAFLSKYPAAEGYPQWYVLAPSGKLLKTENTSELEATHKIAQGYNRDALKRFLAENGPK